ncbi:MAG: nucleoside triphosphate pyrophosphatase [Pseudomonadales bacterium]|nr:nucleoside triphosphate pyrophosphatase [Pseudomonadales bacterium]
MTAPRLVLASTSPHRRQLLARLRVPFEAIAPEVDERPGADESPRELARRLATAKARTVAARHAGEDLLVIGSDQVAELDGRPLGKPVTAPRCVEQLMACSGRTVHFHTGLTVVAARSGRTEAHVEDFAVHFRCLDRNRLEHYVAVEAPLDAAGGFYSEGLGITLFERLEGRDPNALVGLPLIALVDLLAGFGFDLLAHARRS